MGNCTSTSSSPTNPSLYEINDPIDNPSSSSSAVFTSLQYLSRGAINDICTGWDSQDEFLIAEGYDDTTSISSSPLLQPSVHVYSLKENTIVKTFTGHERAITRISLSPSSISHDDTIHSSPDYHRLLASGSRDLSIHIYGYTNSLANDNCPKDVPSSYPSNSYKPLSILKGHEFSISALAFAQGNKRLASGGRDTSIRVWDIATSSCVSKFSIPQNVVTCMKWYPVSSSSSLTNDNAAILVQGSEDLRVRIWDTRTKLQCLKILDGYVYFPLALDISPDGNYILTSSKGFNGIGCELRIWDIRKPNQRIDPSLSYSSTDDFLQSVQPIQLPPYTGHAQDTTGCAFIRHPLSYVSKQGIKETIRCFVSCSKDNTVKLWSQRNEDTNTTSTKNSTCLCEYVQSDAGGFTALSVLENKNVSISNDHSFSTSTEYSYPRIVVVSNKGGVFVYQIECTNHRFSLRLSHRT